MFKKILIIELRPGIGDLCMFIPRIHEIKNKYPYSQITLLTKSRTQADQLLKYDPNIYSIDFIDNGIAKKSFVFLFNYFKKNKFDLVFSYQYGPKYFKYFILSKIFSSKIYHYGFFKKKEPMMQKAIESNTIWLNLKNVKLTSKIYLRNEINEKKNQIVIGLGASGDNKRWSSNNYCELIKLLQNKYQIILAGGPTEDEIIKLIKSVLKNDYISLERKNIEDSIEIIKYAKYHIGNDSGFMHICAGLGMKSFCLYGDTPSEDSIYNKNIVPIMPDNFISTHHGTNAMNKISVEKVVKIFNDNLD